MTATQKPIDRMMCYAWEDLKDPGRTKFGDHYVDQVASLAEAEEHTRKYIRGSFNRQKYKFDEDQIKIHRIWDVSEYAQSIDHFRKHSKIDNVIRRKILTQQIGLGDVHNLPAMEVVNRVEKFLSEVHQPKPKVGLSSTQFRIADEIITAVRAGHNTILAELCARFGKTIWANAVSVELDKQLTIIVSYVKTVSTSFQNELLRYEQFAHHVYVDTADAQYQSKIKKALMSGKKVVAYLSICNGSKRSERINFLFNLNASRFVIIDEADFGVHRNKQVKPLIAARKVDDVVILMTGTNGDRAVSQWNIDYMVSITYPELLIQKVLTAESTQQPVKHLNNFSLNTERDLLIPDVKFYQMDLTGPVNEALKAGEFVTDKPDDLPCWNKFVSHPNKAKGFYINVLESIFNGKNNYDELNIDYQINDYESNIKNGQKVAMMFFGQIRNDAFRRIKEFTEEALPNFEIVGLCGGEKINGTKVTDKNAERIVEEAIERATEKNKSVLILSARLAQRSFSIPTLTELYLAYDNGSKHTTIQKISRVLTPHELEKIGRVISLSFDPNRDDKFDTTVLETAIKYRNTHKRMSMKDAVRDVLRTIDIFKCTADGAIKIDGDSYLEAAIASKSVFRVIGKISNLSLLSISEIEALANGNNEYFKVHKVTKTPSGRVKPKKPKISRPTTKKDNKMWDKAREVIATIAEHIDIIILGSDSTRISDALIKVANDVQFMADIEADFGVGFETIQAMFDRGVINQDMIELAHDL